MKYAFIKSCTVSGLPFHEGEVVSIKKLNDDAVVITDRVGGNTVAHPDVFSCLRVYEEERHPKFKNLPEEKQVEIMKKWLEKPSDVLVYYPEKDRYVEMGRIQSLDKESMYSIKPSPLEVNWDMVDEKYNCVFMDKGGSVYLTDVPVINYDRDGYWIRKGNNTTPWPKAFKIETEGKIWKYSVSVRP